MAALVGLDTPADRCSTCGEPYAIPPTARAVLCSNGFHLCRDCTWNKGRRTTRCARHATPELLAASVAPSVAAIEASLPDLGITVAHGATAQELAEDVASQVLHVVAAYGLADPATLATDALALRAKLRARLGMDLDALDVNEDDHCGACGKSTGGRYLFCSEACAAKEGGPQDDGEPAVGGLPPDPSR